MSAITPPVRALLRLSEDLQRQPTLDGVLQRLVDGAADLLGVEHVSIRLLDATRTLLLARARAGDPFHQNTTFEFVMGEGLVGWVAKHGEPLRLEDAEKDARFRNRPDQTKPLRSFLAVPILEQALCVGVLSAASDEPGRFTEEHEELLRLTAGVCGPHVRYIRVSQLARLDPLTGVHGEQHLDEAYPDNAHPDAEGTALADPFSMMLVEVDEFARLRERFGARFVDDLLRSVAEGVANGVRRNDPIIRRGEHSFLVLLPGVTLATTARIGERVRRIIEADLIASRPEVAKLTVSIGIAERREGERRGALIERATRALEYAKSRGNKVEFA